MRGGGTGMPVKPPVTDFQRPTTCSTMIGERERHHREMQAGHADRRQADQQSDEPGERAGEHDRHEKRHAGRQQQRVSVGADGDERSMTERQSVR